MSYFHKNKRPGMSGLGASPSDCGAGQIFDAYYVYGTLPPGQCVTQAQSDANKAAHPEQYPGGSTSGIVSSIIGGVASFLGSQNQANLTAQQQAALLAQQNQGMSTTTKVALAGGAVLAFALLMRSRSK